VGETGFIGLLTVNGIVVALQAHQPDGFVAIEERERVRNSTQARAKHDKMILLIVDHVANYSCDGSQTFRPKQKYGRGDEKWTLKTITH
jgi:hypothetical protein